MDWVYGIFQCAPLSKTCLLDWDAMAAIGGWTGAIATFVAVVLPYRREVRRARYRARVSLRALRASLSRLEARLDGLTRVRGLLMDGDHTPHAAEIDALLGLAFEVPLFDLDPEIEGISVALAALQNRVNSWEQIVNFLKLGPEDNPLAPRTNFSQKLRALAPMLDGLVKEIRGALDEVKVAIGKSKFGPRLR